MRRRPNPDAPTCLDPRHDPAGPRLPAERLVDAFGRGPAGPARSRCSGHQPSARRNAENFVLHSHYGVSLEVLMAQTGLSRRALYWSIARGRALLAKGLERGACDGFTNPDRDDDEGRRRG